MPRVAICLRVTGTLLFLKQISEIPSKSQVALASLLTLKGSTGAADELNLVPDRLLESEIEGSGAGFVHGG